MLSRSKKLTVKQFEYVLKKGQVFHSPFFWLRSTKIDGVTKVAVICPQKVARSAVMRNQIRRKIYLIVQNLYNQLQPNFQVILCVKDSIAKADQETIQEKTKEIFVKASLLK